MNKTTARIAIYSEKETHSTIKPLGLIDKILDSWSNFLSELVVAIVVVLFSQLIKFKTFECLSGFCYPHKRLR
jgi:hypothetical protein